MGVRCRPVLRARRGLQDPTRRLRRPDRNLRGAALRFVEDVKLRWGDDRVIVVIPEFVVHRWWEHLLHNQAALLLKGSLLFKENVAVVSVPYQVARSNDGARHGEPPMPTDVPEPVELTSG